MGEKERRFWCTGDDLKVACFACYFTPKTGGSKRTPRLNSQDRDRRAAGGRWNPSPSCWRAKRRARDVRVQQQHHPVIVQGQVARQRALLPPGQDLVQIIGWRQRPMQVLGIRRVAAETRVVGGDEPRQPGVRRRGSVPPLSLVTPW